jgi:hypothetical protein
VDNDCPAAASEPNIIMNTADVDYLLKWYTTNGVKLDMVFLWMSYADVCSVTRPAARSGTLLGATAPRSSRAQRSGHAGSPNMFLRS